DLRKCRLSRAQSHVPNAGIGITLDPRRIFIWWTWDSCWSGIALSGQHISAYPTKIRDLISGTDTSDAPTFSRVPSSAVIQIIPTDHRSWTTMSSILELDGLAPGTS